MAQSSSRFIEDEQRDQECLASTGLLLSQNTHLYHSVRERAQKLQDMLALQQQRLRNQHLHLLALEKHLKRQSQKVVHSSLMRKTILLGVGKEQEATKLKEGMQYVGTYRVFVAADWSQVLCIVHNVYLDVLVLDEDVTPLPVLKLSHDLLDKPGLERLPIIIMCASSNPLLQEEHVSFNLIGLEKPITAKSLLRVLHHLLSKQNGSTRSVHGEGDAADCNSLSSPEVKSGLDSHISGGVVMQQERKMMLRVTERAEANRPDRRVYPARISLDGVCDLAVGG